MNISALRLNAKDGANIKAEFLKDETQPVKGVVIIVHGFGEHIGGYKELTEYLARAGFANIVFDQRGHGDLSPYGKLEKLQGIIPSYEALLDDIDVVIAKAKCLVPGVPVMMYGHSMGGNIILNYLLNRNQDDIKCVVLEAPWLGLYKEPGKHVDFIAKILGAISPNIATYNKLPPEDITGDVSKNHEYDDDIFYHNRISLRLFSGVKKGCTNALMNASKLTVPIYLASGKHDQIVCNKTIAGFADSTGKNLITKEYDAYHAIRKGNARDEFFNDMIMFFQLPVR